MDDPTTINKAKLWSNGTGLHYSGVEKNGINHSHSNGHVDFDSSFHNTNFAKRMLFLENENKLLKGNLQEKEAMIKIYKERLELLDKNNKELKRKQHNGVNSSKEMIPSDIKKE